MELMSSGEQEVFSSALSVIKESVTVRPMAKGLPGEPFVLVMNCGEPHLLVINYREGV